MDGPLFIDGNDIAWIEPDTPKFVNTMLKPLYQKESTMPERVYDVVIKAGGKIEPHKHENREVFYITKGEAEVSVGDQYLTGLKGRIFFIPAGVSHGIINNGQEDIHLISFSRH
jgi:quercetin dioxygenase-like cupin family protein